MAAADYALADNLQENINRFFPYLVEIRKRVLFLFSLFLIFGVFGFVYYEKIIVFVLKLLRLQNVNVVFTSPFQFINLATNSGIVLGVTAVFPLIIFQVVSFLKPALRPKEYHSLLALLPISLLLFVTGFIFGGTMMKYVIDIFFKKSVELNIGNMLDISVLLSNILNTSALMGLAFQFPILLTVLMHLKVLKYKTIARQRPFVYCAILVFTLLLPPTDILSDFLLTLPLVFLFEITLILNKVFNKNAN